jgi:starvation-inducible DNA-binding protein
VTSRHARAYGTSATGTKRCTARLMTPTDLGSVQRDEIAAALAKLLADFFVLYIKTKNLHWHVSGPNFRDYHLRFDEQAR